MWPVIALLRWIAWGKAGQLTVLKVHGQLLAITVDPESLRGTRSGCRSSYNKVVSEDTNRSADFNLDIF